MDAKTGQVVEGAPNQDLNAEMLLALGTNSRISCIRMCSRWTMCRKMGHVRSRPWRAAKKRCRISRHSRRRWDTALMMWPRGTSIRSSGNFMAGPFHGLTSRNNNVHALNSDSLLLVDRSPALFGIDKEVYLAILLQNAARKSYRFGPSRQRRPSEFVAPVTPTKGRPGINQVVLPPTYPKGTILTPDGALTSSPGYLVGSRTTPWRRGRIPLCRLPDR